jgi:hypothetical protein
MLAIITDQLNQLGLTKHNYNFALTLIKTTEELTDFMDNFWTSKGNQIFALLSFREQKIKNQTITQNEFVEQFSTDRKAALENLFLHSIDEFDLAILDQKIHNNEVTPESIYQFHIEQPTLKFARFIL